MAKADRAFELIATILNGVYATPQHVDSIYQGSVKCDIRHDTKQHPNMSSGKRERHAHAGEAALQRLMGQSQRAGRRAQASQPGICDDGVGGLPELDQVPGPVVVVQRVQVGGAEIRRPQLRGLPLFEHVVEELVDIAGPVLERTYRNMLHQLDEWLGQRPTRNLQAGGHGDQADTEARIEQHRGKGRLERSVLGHEREQQRRPRGPLDERHLRGTFRG
jgi:hypothetical protein